VHGLRQREDLVGDPERLDVLRILFLDGAPLLVREHLALRVGAVTKRIEPLNEVMWSAMRFSTLCRRSLSCSITAGLTSGFPSRPTSGLSLIACSFIVSSSIVCGRRHRCVGALDGDSILELAGSLEGEVPFP
jgi:hypothetical protein